MWHPMPIDFMTVEPRHGIRQMT